MTLRATGSDSANSSTPDAVAGLVDRASRLSCGDPTPGAVTGIGHISLSPSWGCSMATDSPVYPLPPMEIQVPTPDGDKTLRTLHGTG